MVQFPPAPRTEDVGAVGSGYPSEEEFQRQVRDPDPNDPSAWPVAPVPWLQAEAQQIIVSAPNVGSIGNSLFEDSWGKPLEDTGAKRVGGNLGGDGVWSRG